MITEIDYLKKREIETLLQQTHSQKHLCAILLMLDCGLRVSECISLKIANFDFRTKVLTVSSLKKRGDAHTRTIPLSDRLYKALANYVGQLGGVTPDAYLFPNKEGGHITRFALNKYLQRNFKQKNPVFSNLHPHTLRHTFATHHLSNGTELHNIKLMLGHKKMDTTLIYAHTPIEVLKKHVNNATSEKLSIWERIKLLFFPAKPQTLININTEKTNSVLDAMQRFYKLQTYSIKM